MARQCPRGHDGTQPGEVTDDTSARHRTHQHQISLRGRPNTSRRSSRSPWPRPEAQDALEPRAPGGNQPDLTDRQVRHRRIYWLLPISAANSGGSGRNQVRRRRGRRSRQSSGERRKRGGRHECPVGLTEPPGRVRPGRLAPTGGLGPTGGARLTGGAGEVFNQF
jgi:hypothetical protein